MTFTMLNSVPQALKNSVKSTRATYRQLGRSGLRVSNPILGGLHIGDPKWLPWVLDEEQSLPLLKAAYDQGINTWDTANVYSNGESERIMGKALRVYNIPRQKVTLMTKCYRVVCDKENFDPSLAMTMHHDLAKHSKDYVNQTGLSRSAIFNAVEASLERLNTTYIDLLQIHRYDVEVAPEETMRALHDLVASGKVRYIGASSMWTYQFATLQHTAEKYGWTKFISMQNHYNLLYREEEREMIKFCRETGVGLIPWSPFSAGRLVRPVGSEGGEKSIRCSLAPHGAVYPVEGSDCDIIVSRVEEVAKKRGCPMSHISLAWLNRRVTAPIVGFSSPSRIEEALSARGLELTREEEEYLEEPYQAKSILGHS